MKPKSDDVVKTINGLAIAAKRARELAKEHGRDVLLNDLPRRQRDVVRSTTIGYRNGRRDHNETFDTRQVNLTIPMQNPDDEKLPAELDLEQLRQDGYQAVDWIVDYLSRVEQLPVLSQVEQGSIRKQLPTEPPEQGQAISDILDDLDRIVVPGITHWQSPNFFGYFPANSSPASIIGELVSAGLGAQGMLWATSPACTEIETHVMDWLVAMLGLPERFSSKDRGGGVIQDSASSATLCALIAARERASAGQTNKAGTLDADGTKRQLIAYGSTQAHSSLEKACRIAGIGLQNLRHIEVDNHFAMCPSELKQQVLLDQSQGLQPFFVCANVGTTSSMAIDPVLELGPFCQEHGLWLHVDAAMAGTAAICPELRDMHAGIERADSYTFNPHKWMFTNFDCNAFFVADRCSLTNALSILPEYLRNSATDSGQVIDYRDWQIPLGRRFRSLKLWFVIRNFGVAGLRKLIRQHIKYANWFAQQVDLSDQFELSAVPSLNLVCFHHKHGDAASRTIFDRLNESGKMFLTHTKLRDRFVMRLCIGQSRVRFQHIEAAWKHIANEGSKVRI